AEDLDNITPYNNWRYPPPPRRGITMRLKTAAAQNGKPSIHPLRATKSGHSGCSICRAAGDSRPSLTNPRSPNNLVLRREGRSDTVPVRRSGSAAHGSQLLRPSLVRVPVSAVRLVVSALYIRIQCLGLNVLTASVLSNNYPRTDRDTLVKVGDIIIN